MTDGDAIYILNPFTLERMRPIKNVINPLISEQINAHYTFSFDAVFDDETKYIGVTDIIEVDNDYFQIAKIVKQRGTSVSMSVSCEHVSYKLLDKKKYPMPFEDIEDTPGNIMSALLENTDFTVGTVEIDSSIYYIKPNSDNIRGTLIELANLVGGELVWNKFTVSLVKQRGQYKGLEFKLGENLIGVTEEIDNTGEEPRYALEVDVLDLARLPGYEYLKTVELGDTVRTYDPELVVDSTLRIVSRDYNPFQKVNPRVQIGNVIRDYTDYSKEKEPEELGDLELTEFRIGDVDCLSLSGVDVTEQYINYLQNKDTMSLTDIEVTAVVKYPEYPELFKITGLFLERKEVGGIRVKYISNQTGVLDIYYKDIKKQETVTFPHTDDMVVMVVLSTGAIDVYNPDNEYKVYAVKFGKGEPDTDNYWLSEFRIGDINCLALPGVQMQSEDDEPTAIVEYKEKYQYKGLFVSLKEEYQDYTCEFILYYDDGDIWQETIENGYFDIDLPEESSAWKTTHLVIKVTNPDNTEHQYFGVKFVENIPEPTQDEYRIEFGTCPLANEMTYDFENVDGYDEVISIVTGIVGDVVLSEPINLVAKAIETNGKFKSVKILATWGVGVMPDVEISIQAVCLIKGTIGGESNV